MKKVVLTGGGTAGHVTPNIALLPELKARDYEVLYIGSYNGMEKDIIEETGLPYVGISSGKLRRYHDWKNFSDPFRVIKGYFEAKRILKKEKPNAVFSKGGFVSVPVVLAAKKLHIPAVIHESDITPGLANKLAMRGAVKICCNFPETVKYLPADKAVLSGCPIRKELLEGSKEKALSFTGLSGNKPILLIIGGSLGSVFVNTAVRKSLDALLNNFEIIHLCGKGNLDESLKNTPGYVQYEFISDELPDLFAACDVVISRAGANAICELLALQKPNILVPLSLNASRGDQILNARSFESQGFSYVIEEEQVTAESLLSAVNEVYENRETYISAMSQSDLADPIKTIVDLLDSL